MSETIACPKCGAEMLPGRVVEFTKVGTQNPVWVQGEIERSWLSTMTNPKNQQRDVVTFCCSQCGYMESYGQPVE